MLHREKSVKFSNYISLCRLNYPLTGILGVGNGALPVFPEVISNQTLLTQNFNSQAALLCLLRFCTV